MYKDTNSISIGGLKLVIGNSALNEVGKEVQSFGCNKVLIVTDEGITMLGLHKEVIDSLENIGIEYEIFDKVPSDPPTEIVNKGTEFFKNTQCDGIVSIGGGSVMDCAKLISIMSTNEGNVLDYDNSTTGGKKFKNNGCPLFSIPTTSGTGSEVTQYAVVTSEEECRKASIGDPKLCSKVAFLSPFMTIGLPKRITAATGVDALAHAIEAYTSSRVISAPGSTIFSDTYALKAIELIGRNLKQAYAQGLVLDARKNVMLGSTMAGLVSSAGAGAAHGLAHPLGAHFHVPHGEAVGMTLPYVMEYNINACLDRYKDIAIALGINVNGMSLEESAHESVTAVRGLLKSLDFPKLKDFVPKEEDIDVLVKEAIVEKCSIINTREVTREVAKMIYLRAWNEE